MARAPQKGWSIVRIWSNTGARWGRTTGCTCHVSTCVLVDWGESLAHRAQKEFSSPCQVEFSLCTVGSLHAAKNTNRHQTVITCISGRSFCSFDRGFGATEKADGVSLKAVAEPGEPGRCCWAAMRAFKKSILGSSEPALPADWEGLLADNSGSLDPRLNPALSVRMNCSCCASDHTEGSRGAVLVRSFRRSARCLPTEPDIGRG